MRKIALFALFFVGSVQAILAQDVVARSGEHDSFSRIVFSFSAADDWQIEATDFGHRLEFSSTLLAINVSNVLGLLPSGRLIDVVSAPGSIDFFHDCLCELDAFRFDNSYLVLDLTGDPQSRRQVTPQVVSQDLPKPYPLPLRFNSVADGFSIATVASNKVGVEPISKSSSQETDAVLRELVAEAITGELVVPETNVAQRGRAVIPVAEQFSVSSGIRQRLDAFENQDASRCFPKEKGLDPAMWGSPSEVFARLGDLRQNIISPTFETDPSAVRELALAYVSLRFGAEARAILKAHSIEAPEIFALSEILDGRTPSYQVFQGQISCDSFVALWSYLSGTKPIEEQEINSKAILQTLFSSPQPLRTFLSEQLRKQAPSGSHLAIELNAQSVRRPETIGERNNLNDIGSAVSLSIMLEDFAKRSATAPEEQRKLAESVLRTTPLGEDYTRLATAILISHLAAEAVDEARLLLNEVSTTEPIDSGTIIDAAALYLGPVHIAEFLLFVEKSGVLQDAPPGSQLKLIRVAAENGHHITAQRVLSRSSMAQTPQAKRLAAEISLKLGEIDGALALVQSENEGYGLAFLARLAWASGSPNIVQDSDRSAELDWVAGSVRPSDLEVANSARGELAKFVVTPETQNFSTTDALSDAEDRLSKSQSLRGAITGLLEE